MKNSLHELTIDDLFLSEELEQYKINVKPDSTVASLIFEHLTSKPGFIRHQRWIDNNSNLNNEYLNVLHKIVSKGAPIDIFFFAFSPKVKNPDITNHLTYPDMGDLLTLVHLHLIAKEIRTVYDYGFRFVIAYKGGLNRHLGQWNEKEIIKTYEILQELCKIAEKITGIRNVIKFVDAEKLVNEQDENFHLTVKERALYIIEQYHSGNEYYRHKLNRWTEDFLKALDMSQFQSNEDAKKYLMVHAPYHRALKELQYTGGSKNLGICNRFPNVLRANIRGIDDKLSIQISPYFKFHAHQRLLVLDINEDWKSIKWHDMNKPPFVYEPFYFKEFDYPFYFIEKKK